MVEEKRTSAAVEPGQLAVSVPERPAAEPGQQVAEPEQQAEPGLQAEPLSEQPVAAPGLQAEPFAEHPAVMPVRKRVHRIYHRRNCLH